MIKIGELSTRIAESGLSTKALLENYIKINFLHSSLRKKAKTRNEIESMSINWAEGLFSRRLRQLRDAKKVQDVQLVTSMYGGLTKLVGALVAPTQDYEEWVLRRLYINRNSKLLPFDIVTSLNHEVFWSKNGAVAKTILKITNKRAIILQNYPASTSPVREHSLMHSESDSITVSSAEIKSKPLELEKSPSV